ncbi:MAG: HAD family phosphatase [Tannerella sp.]|jgi:putative hydrolase of the HAD superfamily|nr:HAD family phosphatase [Tannerella sp.]
MIKNIIFDMGGVIVEVRRDRAVSRFRAIGVDDAEQLIDAYHHRGIFLDIESGAIDADTFCRLLCLHAGKHIPRQDIEHAWQSIINPPDPHILDCLLALRKKYFTCLLSNNNPILIDRWARTSRFSTAGRPINDYFDKTYFSYEMKCVKPDIEIYRTAVRDSGITPTETLFLDDSADNIRTAEQVGFATYLVRNGEDWRTALNEILRRDGNAPDFSPPLCPH